VTVLVILSVLVVCLQLARAKTSARVAESGALARLHDRRSVRAALRRQECHAPDVIAMFTVALGAGANVSGALREVAASDRSSLAPDLRAAVADVDCGCSLDAVLQRLGEKCPALSRLTSTLRANVRYGAPVAALLGQLTTDVRVANEHRAETFVKRLSVRLIFPLAGFVLPAFALLTVAPVLVGALSALTSSSTR
jgi:tight adherence protein C